MSGSAILGLDLASNTLKNLSCDPSGNLIVNSSGGGGGGGDASAANQTNGDQKSKCMGIDGVGSQQQLLLESNGSLIIGGGSVKTGIDSLGSTKHLFTNSDGALIIANTNPADPASGQYELLHTDGNGNLNTQVINTLSVNGYRTNISSGATNQHALVNAAGYQYNKIYGNNSGSDVQLKVDANGVLETSGGGSGSTPQNTYSSSTLSVLAPTGVATFKITPTATFDLTNINNITAITIYAATTNYSQIDKFALEYSFDNVDFFSNLSSASSPSFNPSMDLNGVQRTDNGIPLGQPGAGNALYVATAFPDMDAARYVRLVFLHTTNTSSGGVDVDIKPVIVFNGK